VHAAARVTKKDREQEGARWQRAADLIFAMRCAR
jgi:hypothetical protein